MKPMIELMAPILLGNSITISVAQSDYPSLQIERPVGCRARGALDILATQIAPFLEKQLDGADVVVTNRRGAGERLMKSLLADAKPDGYTLGLLSMPDVVAVLSGADVDDQTGGMAGE